MGDRPPWYPNKRPQKRRRRRRGKEGDLEESVVFEMIPPTAPGDTRSDRRRERRRRRRGAEWSHGMTNSTEPIGRRQLRRATHRAEEVLLPRELSLLLFCIQSCLRN